MKMRLSAMLCLAFPLCAGAIHLFVPGDYTCIRDALDAAQPGDEVVVGDGTYYEFELPLKPDVAIWSESGDADQVIIDAQGTSKIFYYHGTYPHLGPHFSISGFTLRGGDADSGLHGGGLDFDPAYQELGVPTLNISNCIFEGNQCIGSGAGLFINLHDAEYAFVNIDNCRFYSNSSGNVGGGLYLNLRGGRNTSSVENCSFIGNSSTNAGAAYVKNLLNGRIANCVFTQNTADETAGLLATFDGGMIPVEQCIFDNNNGLTAGGAWLDDSFILSNCTFYENTGGTASALGFGYISEGTLENCIFASNSGCPSIHFEYNLPTIQCCDMYGNPDGDWVGDIAGHLGLNGNFSEDAQFCDAEDHIFTLAVNSPCAADNNDCGELIGARPVDCESVDTETTLHVPAEYATLALAIDASVDGDTILIECGNYQVDNLQVFSKEIVIRSESSTPECVTLFAGNSGRILTGHGVAGGFRMEGLTLQSADFAALYFYAGAPRIRNCVFQNNNQSIVDYESFTRINNCTFWNNHGPCVSAYSAGFPSVHGSIFWGNHGDLFFESWGGISVSCSDVEGGWPGTGNFDLNPLFCNPNGNLFRLHPESPCSPDNNDCGILIGACSVGCAVSTRSLNWGDLKSLY